MRLLLNLWVPALLLRPLKHVIAFTALVAGMQPWRRRDDPQLRDATVRDLEAYMFRRGRPPFRAPGNCLERSLGAYRLLCAVGAAPRLVIGVRPMSGRVDGHVWIELKGRLFGDDPARVAHYTRIASFDDRGRRTPSEAAEALSRRIRWA